ncbi:uncharacterized protein LOC119610180 [Lucilia sericata]|uniref:uncharacterized protein LOC119610180 n=1 Tax=Lucilia sericata TaxID=13632 RepID=UPI0018A858F3|nr:uncharacterized protein LOC119610180 [Lucilia sericata]
MTEILNTFLEVYRSTPNVNSPNGASPAEAFIGRKMRTIMDVLKKPQPPSDEKSEQMELQYKRKQDHRYKLIRAHVNQLRPRSSNDVDSQITSNGKLPLDVLMEEFNILNSSAEETFSTPPTTPPPNSVPRRITARRQPVETQST